MPAKLTKPHSHKNTSVCVHNFGNRTRTIQYGAASDFRRMPVTTLKECLRKMGIAIPKTKEQMVQRLDLQYRNRQITIEATAFVTLNPQPKKP